MMELKMYQLRALDAFSHWLEVLKEAQNKSETTIRALKLLKADIPDETRNYPKTAWEKLKEDGDVAVTAGKYVDRTDGTNRPIPHICLRCRQVAVKPCLPPLLWNVSIGKPA